MTMLQILKSGRRVALLVGPMAFAMGVACASTLAQEWKEVQVPIGGSKTITVQGPPRIAYFPGGSGDVYLAKRAEHIVDAVKEIPGATLATFDSNWDPQRQRNMLENAIASGKYNAFIVDTSDGNGQCKTLTEAAPAANIAVVNVSTAICGLYMEPDGRDAVADGTIGAVGNNSINAIHNYLNYMADHNPGPQKVLVVTGPLLHPLAPQIDAAVDIIKKERPEFQIVANVKTDFSMIDGYNKIQPLLVANPDTTVIFCANSDITMGAMKAVKEAGLEGKVAIYSQYGNKIIVDGIKAGTVKATTGGYPVGSVDAALHMIRSAFEGQPFERVRMGDGGPEPGDKANWSGVTIIDQTNIAEYQPEY